VNGCEAQGCDINGCFLFTTKSAVIDFATRVETNQCTIQPADRNVTHCVELALGFGGFRVLKVVGKIKGPFGTFDDRAMGTNQTSWTDTVSWSTGTRKLSQATFEHRQSGYDTVEVEMFEVMPSFAVTPPPGGNRVDQLDLNFQLSFT
jgi:hypothetical protein